jgi:hypothetical protein
MMTFEISRDDFFRGRLPVGVTRNKRIIATPIVRNLRKLNRLSQNCLKEKVGTFKP